jgi:glycosyltransferase involved in cell wall biosynthesis
VAVSGSSKDDLRRIYKIPESKIMVIPSGISEKFRAFDRNDPELLKVKEKYGLPWKFILYLGTLEPRKNVVSIVRAFKHLKKEAGKERNGEIAKFKLVLAGSSGWMESIIRREIGEDTLEDIVLTNFIEEEDKPFVYNMAHCLVFPSFLEGFGFPPLEAQGAGIPVIVSNNSSFPETAGSGAIMIDPERPGEIREAIRSLIIDKDLRASLVEKGAENSRKFSWQKTAEDLSELLREIRAGVKK